VKILDISLNISKKNLDKILVKLKKDSGRGTFNKMSRILSCEYNQCEYEERKFKKGDDVVCFLNCQHFFHKNCLEKMNLVSSLYSDNVTYPSNSPIEPSQLETNHEKIVEIYKLNKIVSSDHPQESNNSIFKIKLECKICSKTSME
jgi:hypothetical protein